MLNFHVVGKWMKSNVADCDILIFGVKKQKYLFK
jgi:hypothetical protein